MRTLPQACVDYAHEVFPLVEGDILFTGTPAGVGAVVPGQKSEIRWGNQLRYSVLFD
jgi:fumarylpyruvate hydrolase